MKIIADENIPFAQELFSHIGEVTLKPGRHLSAEDIKGADVLLVRSVTKVNEALLAGSNVKFVGTCTIGIDHLDTEYLNKNNIAYSRAPGCNAFGVVQYVITALAHLDKLNPNLKAAIIGCGNVGGKVYRALKSIGLECVVVDPHLNIKDIPELAPLDSIYDCDIICMHTPRITSGSHPTESLLGAEQFEKMKAGAVLINAGRGECINNPELLAYLESRNDLNVVLDVWTDEPRMNPELFSYVQIGTPHIAGYSYEGKVNGSMMIFEALSAYLNKEPAWVGGILSELTNKYYGPRVEVDAQSLSELALKTYDLKADHNRLAAAQADLPSSFDMLRKSYPKRRELSHYQCDTVVESLPAIASAALGLA